MIGHATRESKVGRRHKPETSHADLEHRYVKLFEALAEFYELLEEYAPAWYTEEHHAKGAAALGIKQKRRRA